MNIIELLKACSHAYPDQPAIIHSNTSVSYRELDQRARAVGAFFQAQGVERGQRALLMLPLSIEFYALFLGLARIGVTAMLIDPAMGKSYMAECCRIASPELFVGSPKAHLLRLTTPSIRSIAQKFSTASWLPGSVRIHESADASTCRDASTQRDDPALITFTSGSTGLPKGICRSHGFLVEQHQAISRALPATVGDIELNTLPIFTLSSLARGITIVIPEAIGRNPAELNAQKIIQQIETQRVNRLLAAPAFYRQLTDHLQANQQKLTGIRAVYTGGGPVFPALLDAIRRQMPNASITAVYGSSEAEPIAHVNMSQLAECDRRAMQTGQGLLAGTPVCDISLAIIPDKVEIPLPAFTHKAFTDFKLANGVVGEIVVSGEHVQKRYLNRASRRTNTQDDNQDFNQDGKKDERMAKFEVDGVVWHRTGDAGRLDEAGRVWLLGRCSARVVSQGNTIYPFAIEAAAMSHSEVERAAFVQVDGKNILALQSLAAHRSSLCQDLQNVLPEVDKVQVVREIPVDKRHHSKVLYAELREILR